ncbi:hypothetical protein GCM10010441_47680 [Kitasatospora paracochleata]|uniref:ATP-binding protein n=1 Tax=Kitasatospora paracochleata TaxID=58354 RepID=UPI0031E38038
MTIASLCIGTADQDRSLESASHHRAKAVVLRDAPASAAAVPALRRFAADAARRRGAPGEAVDRLSIVVTELVTNAVLHSASPDVTVAIEFDDGCMTVEVRDSGSWQSRWSPRHIPEDDVSGGRGLELVRHCSSWWRVFLWVFLSPAGSRVVACLAVVAPTG